MKCVKCGSCTIADTVGSEHGLIRQQEPDEEPDGRWTPEDYRCILRFNSGRGAIVVPEGRGKLVIMAYWSDGLLEQMDLLPMAGLLKNYGVPIDLLRADNGDCCIWLHKQEIFDILQRKGGGG